MKILKYITILTAVAATVSGCSKNPAVEPVEPVEPTPMSEQICFSVPVPKMTKAPIIDLVQVQDPAVTRVYAYGTSGATSVYNKDQITYSATGIWSAATNRLWTAGGSYNFWGMAYSPATAESSNALKINNDGLNIIVSQPGNYSSSGSIDYMLAHQFAAKATSTGAIRGPIVMLEMEHTMAMIEVYVVKNPAMDNATVTNITLDGFYNTGELTCTSHAVYGEKEVGTNISTTNHWTTNAMGDHNASYSLTGNMQLTADRTTTPAVMKFIAIPQQLIDATTLKVDYSIVEQEGQPEKTLSQTFQLYNYPYEWESGKRNIYVLTVDTSIHLYATIKPWPSVSYVNGTILPEIK